jgi:hypothetical protein
LLPQSISPLCNRSRKREVADLMLEALYSALDARVATGVMGEGPYAMKKSPLSKNTCIPIS